MVRTPCCDKNGMKKGTWTPEEDKKLIAYVTRYGCWNWRQLPKFAGLQRCGKSCRLRWLNYLRPNVKRGDYTQEEEEIIIRMHKSLGNKWSAIAAKLPGRTDNEVKNHWHTNLKKRVDQQSESDTQTHDQEESTQPLDGLTSSSQETQKEAVADQAGLLDTQIITSPLNIFTMDTPDILQGLTQLLSPDHHQPHSSFSGFSSSSSVAGDAAATPSMDDLLSDGSFGFLEAYDEAPRSGECLWTDAWAGDSFGCETTGFLVDGFGCDTNAFWDPFVDHDSHLLQEEILFDFGA